MPLKDNPLGIRKIDDAKKAIARDDSAKVDSRIKFVKGDHWQNAEAWSGPIPSTLSGEYEAVAAEIERGFVSKNVIKEVVDRAVNGVMGREPKFTLNMPDKRQTGLQKEAEAIIKKWMEDKDFQKHIQKALRNSFVGGKSTLRLFIPSGLLQDGQVVVNEKDPLSFLFLDAPDPLSAGVVEDPNTKRRLVFISVRQ